MRTITVIFIFMIMIYFQQSCICLNKSKEMIPVPINKLEPMPKFLTPLSWQMDMSRIESIVKTNVVRKTFSGVYKGKSYNNMDFISFNYTFYFLGKIDFVSIMYFNEEEIISIKFVMSETYKNNFKLLNNKYNYLKRKISKEYGMPVKVNFPENLPLDKSCKEVKWKRKGYAIRLTLMHPIEDAGVWDLVLKIERDIIN